MRTLPKVLIGLGAIAGVVVVGIRLGRPGGKGLEVNPPQAIDQPGPAASGESNSSTFFSKHPPRPPREARTNGEPGEVSGTGAGSVITNWEAKVDEILTADSNAADKAKQMLEMFYRLPESGQVEVVKHLSNLLPDKEYGPMGELLLDGQLPGDVVEGLMADALNRPNSVKLPALLEVARSTTHPKAAEARETLGFLLEGDYGEDWDKWQAAVEKWLKENPD